LVAEVTNISYEVGRPEPVTDRFMALASCPS
jgi:hypothetical protein